MDPIVNVEGLAYAHERAGHSQQILADLTLQLMPGKLVVLTGPSGSGKSTLLTIVGGLRRAKVGSVEVFGEQIIGSRERQLIRLRRQIGFIFQQHNLAPALTVMQNIQLGLQLSGGHRQKDAAERIKRAAEQVGLAEHTHKLPGQLSGGQQQRAGIARALVNQPRLVLADEPTASLDRESSEQVMSLFHDLAAAGSSVVLVTHDKRVIDQADLMLALEDGRLVPPADQFMKDTSNSLKKLMEIDPRRLGRLMSFAQPLARVALADGTVDRKERESIVRLLGQRQIFSGAELDLVVDMALAQAQAWNQTAESDEDREALNEAVKAVAMADDVVTEEEMAIIEELTNQKR